ncbi:MAG: TonB family protein [Gemmatimonadota bacterium]
MDAIGAGGKRFLRALGLVVFTAVCLAPAPASRADSGAAAAPATGDAAGPSADNAVSATSAGDRTAAAKGEISRAITSYGKDIRDAYYRALIENPKIEGEIVVSFTVRPGGDVADVRIDRSSLNWPPLEEEVLNRIAAWRFSPFEGDPIPATVPYKFGPN